MIDQLRDKPASLLVVPTGETPLGMFRDLVAAAAAGAVNFADARFVTLDEYAGIGPADRRRLLLWLRTALLDPVGVGEDRVFAFDPAAEPVGEAARVEAAIAAHGVSTSPSSVSDRTAISASTNPGARSTVAPGASRSRRHRSCPTQPTGAPKPTCPATPSPSASAHCEMPPG